MKVDSFGNILWNKEYGGINSDEIFDVIELPNHRLAMCGATGSFGQGDRDAFLLVTDSIGNLIWAKTYGNTCGDYFFKITPDGINGFYIAGYTQPVPDCVQGSDI